MTAHTNLLAALSAVAIGLGAAVSAHAQESAPAPQMEQPAQATPQLDDAKLQSFAVAFLEVSKVNQTYQPQIQQAASDEDRERLQQEAGQKMLDAVDASGGISVDEYNQIIEAAQTDPELAQRINGHITQAAGGAAAPATEEPAPSE